MHSRRGLTLIEVVTVVAVIAILLGILIPAIQQSREEARRTQCGYHLKSWGLALAGYHETWGEFPSAAYDRELQTTKSPLAVLANELEVFPRSHPKILYKGDLPWYDNAPELASYVIPDLLCPTALHPPVITSEAIARLKVPVGSEFATSDYLLSKGPNDSWCIPEGPHKYGPIDDKQLGLFELNRRVKLKEITDGTSQTIAMGEGATGPRWKIMNSKPSNPHLSAMQPDVLDPHAYWICPRINTTNDRATYQIVTASIYATTAILMNEPLITETLADMAALDDCRSTLKGGPHRLGGFRSDHEAGGMFLFADGSVHFLHQDLDPALYRAFSTIRGGESIYFGR
ncbi:MAG: DUF1559 domain-containing protein [Planctomycetaceae bacterium]